jgi:3-hydroxyacyl-CoA dehydrogenase
VSKKAMLDQMLNNASVIGAAGKMGSGIALLLLREMTFLECKNTSENKPTNTQLNLIDRSSQVLDGAYDYLKTQIYKFAEKQMERLRKELARESDTSDSEMIEYYCQTALKIIHLSTDISAVSKSRLVFEAVFENLEIKKELYQQLKKLCPANTYFFSNTSSIPISVIEKSAEIEGRLIGFHFYNPPAVQRLLEVITTDSITDQQYSISIELGRRLNKTMVFSKDIAGFIGNGHFIRDGLFGIQQVESMQDKIDVPEAIFQMNQVTQHFLIRPMGIFQLIDYVGLGVFQMISETMDYYINNESFSCWLIEKMLKADVSGGQNSDGTQKNGFFRYENNQMTGIYDLKENRYIDMSSDWVNLQNTKLGPVPNEDISWKSFSKDPDKKAKLNSYFVTLFNDNGLGAQMAMEYLQNSLKISNQLVSDQVAKSMRDVSKILKNGFYHLYGPEIPFLAVVQQTDKTFEN